MGQEGADEIWGRVICNLYMPPSLPNVSCIMPPSPPSPPPSSFNTFMGLELQLYLELHQMLVSVLFNTSVSTSPIKLFRLKKLVYNVQVSRCPLVPALQVSTLQFYSLSEVRCFISRNVLLHNPLGSTIQNMFFWESASHLVSWLSRQLSLWSYLTPDSFKMSP